MPMIEVLGVGTEYQVALGERSAKSRFFRRYDRNPASSCSCELGSFVSVSLGLHVFYSALLI